MADPLLANEPLVMVAIIGVPAVQLAVAVGGVVTKRCPIP